MRTTRAALFLGAAILSAPAFAQDAPQQVTPPPIMTTPSPAPAPAAQPQVVMQPSAPVVQSVPSVEEQQRGAAAADAPAPVERRATATRTTTTRTTTTATRPAPAPARQAAPAPAAETPTAPPSAPVQAVPEPLPPEVQPAPAPEAAQPVAVDSSTTTTSSSSVAWPWLLGGIVLVIAGLAVFLLSRRRRNDEATTTDPVVAEPVYVAPVAREPIVEPVAAPEAAVIAQVPPADERIDPRAVPPAIVTPVAAAEQVEEAELADASKDDLAGVADAAAPVSQRPWIELGLRPVSAGTSEEEAMVDFELTVGNSGDTEARNVRISSFMLAEEAEGTEMERMLMEHRTDPIVPPVSIEPGDGTRVDAHLAVPKGELGRTFNPVVVAEARYTLPDGSEARTSAAFKIGRPAYEGGIGAIGSSRPHVVEDLAAELYGQPEHA